MKASKITAWPSNMQPHEWPAGTLDHMDADLFTDCAFPLRKLSGIPMTPSSLYGAHVRHDDSGSRHSTKKETRLSDATDLHVSSIGRMIAAMLTAEQIPAIGGIGIYFDTNTPLIHIDKRPNRLVWLCYTENGKRVYLYRENDAVKFYKKLGDLLTCN
jgi:hypothetical protein